MNLNVFTDGGSINNPGRAAIAYIVSLNDKLLFKFSKRIGINTNNFAEYSALVGALEWVKNNTKLLYSQNNACVRIPLRFLGNRRQESAQITKVVCHSDSHLMVNQLNGLFKVKNSVIRDFIMKVRIVEQEVTIPILYKYIPREQNRFADSLVKKELLFLPA
ncbi:ribonuclease HI family protein [Candidatus Roizmanbacteria bacterium]|nr:ribonuclease HI family protein [Candidatus Roizmanbacteria bacterium]